MKNPWTKKNPFLSMWLSGANAVAGAGRSRAKATARRAGQAAVAEGMKQAADFWTGAWLQPAPRKRKRRGKR